MDPALVLGGFSRPSTLDRRAAITEAETMKARRNKLTGGIPASAGKKMQDTAANLQEQKELKEKIADAEKIADDCRRKTARHLNRHPQPAQRQRAHRQERRRQRRSPPLGHCRRSSISLPSRTGNWAKSSASSISNAPPRSPARASPSIGTSERVSNAP